MSLPKVKKKLVTDIGAAVQRAAATEPEKISSAKTSTVGRPTPRVGVTVRQTLLLREEVAGRLTMAFAREQVKRRKVGEKMDKSSLIEEMIVAWLDNNKY